MSRYPILSSSCLSFPEDVGLKALGFTDETGPLKRMRAACRRTAYRTRTKKGQSNLRHSAPHEKPTGIERRSTIKNVEITERIRAKFSAPARLAVIVTFL